MPIGYFDTKLQAMFDRSDQIWAIFDQYDQRLDKQHE